MIEQVRGAVVQAGHLQPIHQHLGEPHAVQSVRGELAIIPEQSDRSCQWQRRCRRKQHRQTRAQRSNELSGIGSKIIIARQDRARTKLPRRIITLLAQLHRQSQRTAFQRIAAPSEQQHVETLECLRNGHRMLGQAVLDRRETRLRPLLDGACQGDAGQSQTPILRIAQSEIGLAAEQVRRGIRIRQRRQPR